MSDTPRTDGEEPTINTYKGGWVRSDFARQLERELAAANAKIQRLTEAGDNCADYSTTETQEAWIKAKEGV